MRGLTVVYGSPAAGKSTLVRYLREHNPGLRIIELDEELISGNQGRWPEPSEYRNSVVVPKVLKRIAGEKSGIFFTSALSEELAVAVRSNGGKIVLLKLSKEKLLERDASRAKGEQSAEDQIVLNLADQERYAQSIGYDLVIDAAQPVEKVAELILSRQ